LTVTPGTRLGVYEITAQIGAGGMGEVYRATDSDLKRQVAIKVLPAAMSSDADHLARFQREAEVLASLNHPSIAAIYGLEKTATMNNTTHDVKMMPCAMTSGVIVTIPVTDGGAPNSDRK
jgi:serine/threonine protein kinase